MSPILTLPLDILCLIPTHLPPSSHFPFASTCTTFAAASHPLLRRHQAAHAKYKTASDRDPETLLLLLESAFSPDPLVAWHVRSFEVWRDRKEWADWGVWSLDGQGECGTVADAQIVRFRARLENIGEYMDWFGEYSCAGREIEREDVVQQLERGCDGVLKALLIARLPRLREVRVVTRSQGMGSTLSWLKRFVAGLKIVRPRGSECCTEREDLSPCSETSDGWRTAAEMQEDLERASLSQDEVCQHTVGEYEASLLQGQVDDCCSPTQIEFDREWEKAYANWVVEQELQELEKMEIDDVERDTASAQDVEMTQHVESTNSEIERDNLDHGVPSEDPIDTDRWPPGFASLRSVAIGVVSGTWMDDDHHPNCSVLVARLFRLPNLETLYFNGLRCDPDDGSSDYEDDNDSAAGSTTEEGEWLIYDFPSHSMSVKHLFFEGLAYELEGEFIEWLCAVPRSLLSIAFKNSGPEADDFHRASRIVRELDKSQGASLESMMWYGFDSDAIRSDECSVVELKEHEMNRFRALKQLSFNVQDFATAVYHETWEETPEGYESLDDYYVEYVSQALPTSLETLVLWEDAGAGLCGDQTGETVLLERAIISMIQDGRYDKLKAIFLDQVERVTDRGDGKVSFERAVAAGKAAGVDVFTRTNRPTERDMSFPAPVDRYDLQTGRFSGSHTRDYVFDCYTGCREPFR